MTRRDEIIKLLSSGGVGAVWSTEAIDLAVQAAFRCEYCDRDLLASVDDYDALQGDHIIPTSKGGLDEFGNKALSCRACNFLKRAFDPREFVDPGHTADRAALVKAARLYVQKKRAKKLMEVAKLRELALELLADSPG